MGVNGLWRLLLPIGRRISIETLEGKVLAIDASIWLTQFIKAMRDPETGSVRPAAHIIGFFRRLCRLRFHGIRPVLVFDGETPEIKRRELFLRRKRREQFLSNHGPATIQRMAKRILLDQLRKKGAAKKNASFVAGFNPPSEKRQAISESQGAASQNDTKSLEQTKEAETVKQNSEEDISMEQKQPDKQETDEESINDWDKPIHPTEIAKEESSENSDDGSQKNGNNSFQPKKRRKQMKQNFHYEDFDPDLVASLDPNQRKEAIEIAKRQERMRSRQEFMPVAANPEAYSSVQLKNFLRSSKLNKTIVDMATKASRQDNKGQIGELMASDRTRRIVLERDDEENKQSLFATSKRRHVVFADDPPSSDESAESPQSVNKQGRRPFKKPRVLAARKKARQKLKSKRTVQRHRIIKPTRTNDSDNDSGEESFFLRSALHAPQPKVVDSDSEESAPGGFLSAQAQDTKPSSTSSHSSGKSGTLLPSSSDSNQVHHESCDNRDNSEGGAGFMPSHSTSESMRAKDHEVVMLDSDSEGGGFMPITAAEVKTSLNGGGFMPSNSTTESRSAKLSKEVVALDDDDSEGGGFMPMNIEPKEAQHTDDGSTSITESRRIRDSKEVVVLNNDHSEGGGFIPMNIDQKKPQNGDGGFLPSNVIAESRPPAESNDVVTLDKDHLEGGGFIPTNVEQKKPSDNSGGGFTSNSGSLIDRKGSIEDAQAANSKYSLHAVMRSSNSDTSDDEGFIRAKPVELETQAKKKSKATTVIVIDDSNHGSGSSTIVIDDDDDPSPSNNNIESNGKSRDELVAQELQDKILAQALQEEEDAEIATRVEDQEAVQDTVQGQVKEKYIPTTEEWGDPFVTTNDSKDVHSRAIFESTGDDDDDDDVDWEDGDEELAVDDSFGPQIASQITHDAPSRMDVELNREKLKNSGGSVKEKEDSSRAEHHPIEHRSKPARASLESPRATVAFAPPPTYGDEPETSLETKSQGPNKSSSPEVSEDEGEETAITQVVNKSPLVPATAPSIESSFVDNTAALEQAEATASNLTNWAGRAVRRAIAQHLEQTGTAKPRPTMNSPEKKHSPHKVHPHEESAVAIQATESTSASHNDEFDLMFDPEKSAETAQLVQNYENDIAGQANNLERELDTVTDEMREDVIKLLQLFGIPYVQAPAEAEAQCVTLEKLGLVDGIVTEDSDVFVFGGKSVYKNIFEDQKYVEEYRAQDAEKEMSLGPNQFVALAMLLGGDYTEGVKGVGIVNGMEILEAFDVASDLKEGLQNFRSWLDGFDPSDLISTKSKDSELTKEKVFALKHRTARGRWSAPESFPADTVISAYQNPVVDPSSARFSWGIPDMEGTIVFCNKFIGWPPEDTKRLLEPVIERVNDRFRQTRLDSFMRYEDSVKFADVRSKRLRSVLESKQRKNKDHRSE